jgi:hypothetical protein
MLYLSPVRFCRNSLIFAVKIAVMDENGMGDVINLRRVRKTQRQAVAEAEAAANRVVHGTPKHLRKLGKSEKQRANRKIAAHKLDQKV